MKFLYHVSPILMEVGTFLKGKKSLVCLATSVRQAIYWAYVLYDGEIRPFKPWDCWIYKVKVLGDGMVEDCRGHYHFEYPGVWKKVEKVKPHNDLDGEVVTDRPVVIVERVGQVPKGLEKYFQKLFFATI